MPEFHKLNKSRTTEMSKEELNRRLREEVEKSEAKALKKKSPITERKQQKLSEQAKKQLPPQSPVKKKRAEELKKQEKEAKKEEKKAKKRRRHGSYIIYYITLSMIAFIIFAILSVTVLFNCEEIIVEGETVYSDEEIIEASGLKGNENLVRLSLSGIDKRILDKLVSLDSAELKKVFPNKVKITVVAAEPMANFYYAGKNYVISHVGRVMQIESSAADCMEVIGYQPGDNVVIGDYITAANPEQDVTVKTISDTLEKIGIDNITELNISDTLNITITYEDRVKVTLGSILQLEEKLTIVKELVENPKYIGKSDKVSLNVSNPEKVYQRPLTPLITSPVVTTTPEETEVPEESAEDTAEEE